MDAGDESAERSAAAADLWRFYEEHAAQARQHENMRATVTSTLAAIAAAVIALAGVGGLSTADVPAGLVVVVLSGLGVVLNIKHYERYRFHTTVLDEIRNEIDRIRPSIGLKSTHELRRTAKRKHAEGFSILKQTGEGGNRGSKKSSWVVRARLHVLWLGLPIAIGMIGVLVVVLAVVGVSVK